MEIAYPAQTLLQVNLKSPYCLFSAFPELSWTLCLHWEVAIFQLKAFIITMSKNLEGHQLYSKS